MEEGSVITAEVEAWGLTLDLIPGSPLASEVVAVAVISRAVGAAVTVAMEEAMVGMVDSATTTTALARVSRVPGEVVGRLVVGMVSGAATVGGRLKVGLASRHLPWTAANLITSWATTRPAPLVPSPSSRPTRGAHPPAMGHANPPNAAGPAQGGASVGGLRPGECTGGAWC